MKIALHENDDLVWIAPGGKASPGAGLRHATNSKMMMNPRVGAAFAVARNFGNAVNTFTFTVWREFETPALAEDFIITHAAEANATGVLTITLSDDATVYYAYGHVKITSAVPDGVSVDHTYSIECGKISKIKSEVLP